MRIFLSVSGAAALTVGFLLFAPSFASSWAAAVIQAHSDVRNSHNFAGYVYEAVNETSFNVTAELVVPKLKCTKGSERAIDPSVGISAKKRTTLAGLFVGCSNGKPEFFPNLEVNGRGHNYSLLAARPGDMVVLRVVESASATTVSVTNKTHKFKKSLKGPGNSKLSGPWVGDVGWYKPKLLGVPIFGSLHFSDSKLDGTAFAAWGATTGSGSTPVREDRAEHGTTKIATGAFAKNGESFTTTFKGS